MYIFLLILKFFSPETRCIKIDLYDCVCCGGVVIADSLLIMYIYAVKVNMAHRVNIPPGGSKHKKNYIFFSRQSKTSIVGVKSLHEGLYFIFPSLMQPLDKIYLLVNKQIYLNILALNLYFNYL